MKNYKYIGLFLLSLSIISCDVDNTLPEIEAEAEAEVQLNTNGLDFSKYVAVGASFTAGFTDNALFKAAQENSFPNILASKFAMAGGGEFNQPLMNDNIGGLVFGTNLVQGPRLYFNGAGPVPLAATPTTDVSVPFSGSVNNYGIPGAKSFHFLAPNYGNLTGLFAKPRTANPYFVRIASSSTARPIDDIIAKKASFFTLSEIGGNDVLGYALSGGESNTTADNFNPITPTTTFDFAFSTILNGLTANGAKGVVANIPYITSLAHFTTVPYNPVPLDAATATQLNTQLLGPVIQILTALGQGDRLSPLSAGANNPLLIKDESLINLSAQLAGALQGAGVPAGQASLMGFLYGQTRHAKSTDLFVLPLSSFIGKEQPGIPAPLNTIGVTYPLADKWVLTPEEQEEIKTATDAYNTTIESMANANANVALVDFKSILTKASTSGLMFDGYNMTTSLVTGGLISLDGVHLTGRGYAMMANEILKATDTEFGSNFTTATNGLAKADDHPTNYSPTLK